MVEQYESATSNTGQRFTIRTSADEPSESQLTKKGYSIPVPRRTQVMDDFEKIVSGKSEEDSED